MNTYVILYSESKIKKSVIWEADSAEQAKRQFILSFDEKDFEKIDGADVHELMEYPSSSYVKPEDK